MIDVHNLVFERLTSLAISDVFPDTPDLIPLDDGTCCSYCTRQIKQQPAQYKRLGFVGQNSYGDGITLCLCCQVFNINNPSVMGIETLSKPNVGQKWGMLAGSGVFIDLESNKTLLFMPKKSSDKLPESTVSKAKKQYGIEIVNVSGITKQLEAILALQPKGKCIWISNFGRKTDILINNLAVSEGLNALVEVNDAEYNSSTRAIREIDVSAVMEVATMLSLHPKGKNKFIQTVTDYLNGRLPPQGMMDAFDDNALIPLRPVMQKLPTDPHARLKALDLAKKITVPA